jgi:hypothetical protein
MGRAMLIVLLIRVWIPVINAQDSARIPNPLPDDSLLKLTDSILQPAPNHLSKADEVIPSGICNQVLSKPLTVRVTDIEGNPVQGAMVTFRVIDQPSGAQGTDLYHAEYLTDSIGKAGAKFSPGSEPGTYYVAASIPGADTPMIIRRTGSFPFRDEGHERRDAKIGRGTPPKHPGARYQKPDHWCRGRNPGHHGHPKQQRHLGHAG